MITCTVIANVLMKIGSADSPSPWLLGAASWRTLLGLISFGSAALFYSAILRSTPLNLAQSLAAGQFVAVILVSNLWLGEPIQLSRWIGIALITVGILVVSASAGEIR